MQFISKITLLNSLGTRTVEKGRQMRIQRTPRGLGAGYRTIEQPQATMIALKGRNHLTGTLCFEHIMQTSRTLY